MELQSYAAAARKTPFYLNDALRVLGSVLLANDGVAHVRCARPRAMTGPQIPGPTRWSSARYWFGAGSTGMDSAGRGRRTLNPTGGGLRPRLAQRAPHRQSVRNGARGMRVSSHPLFRARKGAPGFFRNPAAAQHCAPRQRLETYSRFIFPSSFPPPCLPSLSCCCRLCKHGQCRRPYAAPRPDSANRELRQLPASVSASGAAASAAGTFSGGRRTGARTHHLFLYTFRARRAPFVNSSTARTTPGQCRGS